MKSLRDKIGDASDEMETIPSLHYAESETFATLKKRQLWKFFSPI